MCGQSEGYKFTNVAVATVLLSTGTGAHHHSKHLLHTLLDVSNHHMHSKDSHPPISAGFLIR